MFKATTMLDTPETEGDNLNTSLVFVIQSEDIINAHKFRNKMTRLNVISFNFANEICIQVIYKDRE